ncbi:MAG: creatininase family protein [Candidatus Latescibacterota bacterium]|jgi:creatinine amidohydrolase|nr:hypothetical protein [Gemmatimonadaceae bacterium]MDP6983966.1 creatininase family protein [Candidatus Latescibacterota bacterium]MED5413378.1 creatininase family protein [Candidatus Latescibacterota bacterium]MEE3264647.1 creatininase family protein [Candidatus Latescibacterota bacterium]MEE3334975.1 creatininase family protein [Candidatus Latescibacterota bacterium]
MSAAPAFPGLLEEMTTQDIQAFDPEVVVLPLGSTEPHGPHLPMGTDCYQVTRLCHLAVRAANENSARVLLYPTLPITNNANFRRFRFALRVGIRTLMQILIDIVTQCRDDGIRKVVFVNGHGGNPATLDATLREIAGMDDMPFVCWTWGAWPEGVASPIEHASDHGGEDETSRMLWIRPDLVRSDKLANNPFGQLRIARLKEQTHFVRPWHLYVPESAGGEARESSAQKGQVILETKAGELGDLLVELSETPWDERFPYI